MAYSISSFSVTQTAAGNLTARYVLVISGSDVSSVTWEIEAQDSGGSWWTKASGTASAGTKSGTLSFDEFRTYNVRAKLSTGVYRATTVTLTDSSPTAPDKWSWTASNGSATAAQTAAAYAAVTGQGETTDFSYLVWNDLCAKVREVRTYAGVGSWDTAVYGQSYAQTCMTSADKTLTALRFNALRYNIGSQYPTGISELSAGDAVLGSYFTTLTTAVNAWIDSV